MVEKAGAQVVACAFAIELAALHGAARLAPREIFSLIRYE
jgi:adenine/guanine phosphoribosyltransferase-like PRPP-binding protein